MTASMEIGRVYRSHSLADKVGETNLTSICFLESSTVLSLVLEPRMHKYTARHSHVSLVCTAYGVVCCLADLCTHTHYSVRKFLCMVAWH